MFSDGVAELHTRAPDADGFPARVIDVATTLIGADSCSYNRFAGPALLAWRIQPAGVGVFPGAAEAFDRHLPEHPVLAHHRTGDGSARRISDFLSDRQFRSLGLYSDFYRPADVVYQLAITLRGRNGNSIGVALNRRHRDFADAEVILLDRLGTHIGLAAAAAEHSARPRPTALRDPQAETGLSARQLEVMRLVAKGHTDRLVGLDLGISDRTVNAHLQNTYRILGVASRTQAIARLRTLLSRPTEQGPQPKPSGTHPGSPPPTVQPGRDPLP